MEVIHAYEHHIVDQLGAIFDDIGDLWEAFARK
jgi:hypothetical protein